MIFFKKINYQNQDSLLKARLRAVQGNFRATANQKLTCGKTIPLLQHEWQRWGNRSLRPQRSSQRGPDGVARVRSPLPSQRVAKRKLYLRNALQNPRSKGRKGPVTKALEHIIRIKKCKQVNPHRLPGERPSRKGAQEGLCQGLGTPPSRQPAVMAASIRVLTRAAHLQVTRVEVLSL